MPFSDWIAFSAYLKADLGAISGVKLCIEGDLTQRPDYSEGADMVAFYALLGEGGSIGQNTTGSTINALDKIRVRVGIACESTKPDAPSLATAHYLLQEWRATKWSSDQTFGSTCQWNAVTLISDRVSPLPVAYMDLEITLG